MSNMNQSYQTLNFNQPGVMSYLADLIKNNREITTSEQRQVARAYLRACRFDFKLSVGMLGVMFFAFVIPGGMIEAFPNALPYDKLIIWDIALAILLILVLGTTTVLLYRWRLIPLSAELKRIASTYHSLAELCDIPINTLLEFPRSQAEYQIVTEMHKILQEAANALTPAVPLYSAIEETPEFSLLKGYHQALRETDLEIKDMQFYMVTPRAT